MLNHRVTVFNDQFRLLIRLWPVSCGQGMCEQGSTLLLYRIQGEALRDGGKQLHTNISFFFSFFGTFMKKKNVEKLRFSIWVESYHQVLASLKEQPYCTRQEVQRRDCTLHYSDNRIMCASVC